MSTMTPEARMELASERLNAWLEEFDKLEDPIETALCDLGVYVSELGLHGPKCWAHEVAKCEDCLTANIKQAVKHYGQLRKLWEERA